MIRHIRSQMLTRFKTDAPLYWEALKTTKKEAFLQKVQSFNNWYTKLLGLDEVKLYQDRVVALQERLLEAQEKRREIGRNLAEIRKKSNLLQDELHKVKRQEDIEKFLMLMKEETEVLKLEHEASRSFQEYDRAEREVFSAFTNAVRDSHEKQRAQLEYTKYFGIILSITGSFLAFCYTTFRKGDLKRCIQETLAKNATNQSDNSELVKVTSQLKEIISLHQTRQLQGLISPKQNVEVLTGLSEKEKEIMFYIGASVLALILIKAVSG